ncbi:50S ribosomal protein L29 [Candidatus Uhrbacteria bacterium]|nr:50S ribosomal protein L29 [Candidatus Uhrbacteria bacterium]
MKLHELREKSADELRSVLAEARVSLVSLRMKAAASQLKNVRDIRRTKKTIARALTLLSRSANITPIDPHQLP